MVQFEGKYELEKSENFVQYLKSLGTDVTDEAAQELEATRAIFIVRVERDLYTFSSKIGSNNHVLGFTINKPFQETLKDHQLENIATLNENTITIKSTFGNETGERTYAFSDAGLIITYNPVGSNIISKRYYKKV